MVENHLCPKQPFFSPFFAPLFPPLKFWPRWIFRSAGNSFINPASDKKASQRKFSFCRNFTIRQTVWWIMPLYRIGVVPEDVEYINMIFWNIKQPIQNLFRYLVLGQVRQKSSMLIKHWKYFWVILLTNAFVIRKWETNTEWFVCGFTI